ncbi:MAG TPA: TonB-dependent receptor plug domain-containing protein [Gemmatimonadales bacterium]|nr:TonB-dependent receptor plug domain-containing protein [Gemmatimonadales bacterium]
MSWTLGCSHSSANHTQTTPNPSGLVITAAQIERSGSKNAWEVLKHDAPMLTLEEDRNGNPARIHWHGRSSIYLEDAPVVILDGVRTADWKVLSQVPAGQIETIHIISGIEGTTYYGTNAESGVIEIQTKHS